MKKIKFITLTILMLMLTVFALTNIKTKDIEVKAAEAQEVNLKIYKNNVSYSSELSSSKKTEYLFISSALFFALIYSCFSLFQFSRTNL